MNNIVNDQFCLFLANILVTFYLFWTKALNYNSLATTPFEGPSYTEPLVGVALCLVWAVRLLWLGVMDILAITGD